MLHRSVKQKSFSQLHASWIVMQVKRYFPTMRINDMPKWRHPENDQANQTILWGPESGHRFKNGSTSWTNVTYFMWRTFFERKFYFLGSRRKITSLVNLKPFLLVYFYDVCILALKILCLTDMRFLDDLASRAFFYHWDSIQLVQWWNICSLFCGDNYPT